ncbi:hypothetical protein CRG98_007029 [Punica granatum]|uniref:GDSL esterase/lipase n=1 Tax=Punica granatum TaxID=22663 RepID=A0A2I0KW01_PUNGR|nr:hypothetical protein CRG98_007029 [Punica granatum]
MGLAAWRDRHLCVWRLYSGPRQQQPHWHSVREQPSPVRPGFPWAHSHWKFLPAYLDPALKDEDLLTGASFASAGSGIDDETAVLGHLLTLESQVHNFKIALRRIERQVGPQEAHRIINNALFVISSGTNDMLNNFYWLPEARFAYADTYKPLMDMIQNPYREGFGVSAEGCCGTGLVETGPLCLVLTPKCIDPSRYVCVKCVILMQRFLLSKELRPSSSEGWNLITTASDCIFWKSLACHVGFYLAQAQRSDRVYIHDLG